MGSATVLRIPVPGTDGLAIELRPRGRVPIGGSTSTVFIQGIDGKRNLRLDYGYNVRTNTVDYHWNQKGTNANFGIADHALAGRGGAALYQGAKYFKYLGRSLIVVGAAVDALSIVQASRPLQRTTEVVTAWAGAGLGCRAVGAGGAALGTAIEPGGGTIVLGLLGCVVGGVGGYLAGEKLGATVFNWAEGTLFMPLPAANAP
ncbi:MAG: hypothetical protein LC098_08655 [Burkholderiales bacterium]|nr:hypothetical protein [Burkholderiales bacterium]